MNSDLHVLITPTWASSGGFRSDHIWYLYPVVDQTIESAKGAFLQFTESFIMSLSDSFDNPVLREIMYYPHDPHGKGMGTLCIYHDHARALEEFEFYIRFKEIKKRKVAEFLTHKNEVIREWAKINIITPDNPK